MSVYKRGDSNLYSYDFRLDGERYSGFTGTDDLDEALAIERSVKDGLLGRSAFCRRIIRSARRSLPTRETSRRGYVYMMKAGYFVKIGHSLEPTERWKAISTATPHDCELLFCMPGSLAFERQLHAEFAACHYNKEWFFNCGKLKGFIQDFEKAGDVAETMVAT